MLAAATPHVARVDPLPNYLVVPSQISYWGNDEYGDCVSAEEAFAKACNSPEIFIPSSTVVNWAKGNGLLHGAYLTDVLNLMHTAGFTYSGCTYKDGPHTSVDWTNPATIQSAITQGPVKLGVAADQIETACNGRMGWFGLGFTVDDRTDHCVSLCGYGSLSWLAQQLNVTVPASVDGEMLGYAMFTWCTIGIVDAASMVNVTQEAWLRSPTTMTVGVHGLYVLHQGTANDLRYILWDGQNWYGDQIVSNVSMAESPSAVLFGGQLYAFHQDTSSVLRYSVFDGVSWGTDIPLNNVGIVGSPAAVVYNNQLYVFHQGTGNDLWFKQFDGTNWSDDTNVPYVGVQGSPSAVVYNNLLYVFHQGMAQDLRFSVFNGTTWSTDTQVDNVNSPGSPSAVVADGALYVFHQGSDGVGNIWYSVFDGATWAPDTTIPNLTGAAGQSAIVTNGELDVFYESDNVLLYATFVFIDETWLLNGSLPYSKMVNAPSAVYWV
ncbi:hypothetical protein CR152_29905 [Massilia violaceinigra]|uniref:Uncharacterized protein n=1 Tax=Massilia violaceinigra TaxID=2045208 RepID=A0A2D2DTF2_9BURK|nr:glycoside hydrolase [Massilia violaceinigra]ATQ78254.1 hypothetical protein CR152_29905 [Massilia violaceinigra]